MLSKFLEFLFDFYTDESLWIEVRRISPPSQRFFPIHDLTGVVQDAEGDTNVFVGVLPRTRKSGTAADVVSHTDILWADLDKKSGAIFDIILASRLPIPNVILDSGHGWHLYWTLDIMIPVGEAQQRMAGIANLLGGDAVGDPARIMRLPDTLNIKADNIPVPVRVIRFNNTDRSRPSLFQSAESVYTSRKNNHSRPAGVKTRSEELFAIAIDGVLHGQSMGEVRARMLNDPAGSKLLEMTYERRQEWIRNALRNAKKITGKRPTN